MSKTRVKKIFHKKKMYMSDVMLACRRSERLFHIPLISPQRSINAFGFDTPRLLVDEECCHENNFVSVALVDLDRTNSQDKMLARCESYMRSTSCWWPAPRH